VTTDASSGRVRAIDCLVNVDFGDVKQPEWMTRVKEDYFKGGDSFLESKELPQLLDEMDANGIEKAILLTKASSDDDRARRYAEAEPDRFALGVGGFNLLKPMKTVRTLESLARDLPVAYAIVGPSFWGDGNYPPSDAVYYPLYTKCCELELPLCLNTGIPGPPIPAEAQNPIHLDRVCVRFPELNLVMVHGADPWWDVAIRLMIKYRNLRLMTSAWSPKYLPEQLLHYMRTRGKDRILFASDNPVLSMERCITEATALDLPPEVLDAWLYGNADALFFGSDKWAGTVESDILTTEKSDSQGEPHDR
jgi:predicted TIM-barrel fold metal-dependent hydrolase